MPAPLTRANPAQEGRRVLLAASLLLLSLGCAGDDAPTGPFETLEVTTTTLADGIQNAAYSESLAAEGGDASYDWTVTDGAVPTGLSIDASTGEIFGTPMGAGSTFTVQVASGDGQTAIQQLTIDVNPFCVVMPDTAIATFEDPTLEVYIRAALTVDSQADLTCALLFGLTSLESSSSGIESLVGIENLTSVATLSLGNNLITDISSLGGLTSLTSLVLNDNLILDISPLSGLASLTDLQLHSNAIDDITVLSELTGLENLRLNGNSISDISALSELTGLAILHLWGNSITDISALTGLTGLWVLRLNDNPDLTDIQPLLDNMGLGAEALVDLRSTNVSCPDVAALQANGVLVLSDCP